MRPEWPRLTERRRSCQIIVHSRYVRRSLASGFAMRRPAQERGVTNGKEGARILTGGFAEPPAVREIVGTAWNRRRADFRPVGRSDRGQALTRESR